VALLGRLLRAQVRAGNVTAARATRRQAIAVALQAGRGDLLIAAFAAWTEPTPWQTHPYGFLDVQAVDLLVRLLERDDLEPVVRCRLLDALTAELEGEDDPRAAAAGHESLALARTLDDPALLAMALCGTARVFRYDVDVVERQAIGEELLELATRHGLLSYHWSALHILGTVAAARNDVQGVRDYLTRAVAIAEAYQMMEPLAIKLYGKAMLAHIAGHYDEAERCYLEATERLHRLGSLHALAFRTLALMTVRASQGRLGEFAPQVEELAATYGPMAADMLAVVLAEAGRIDDARAIHEDLPPIRVDYFSTAFLTVRAMAVVRLGKKELAEELIERLTPARHQLPGVASTALAMRPVAYTLGTLFELLGRSGEAAEHFALAREVAQLWGAEQWL
jgi:tetratricopeptide (TPR) repeat protein